MQLPSEQAKPAAPYQKVDVPDALRVMRPTLGDNGGTALYGLPRLVAFEDITSRGAAGTAYLAGKNSAHHSGKTNRMRFWRCATYSR